MFVGDVEFWNFVKTCDYPNNEDYKSGHISFLKLDKCTQELFRRTFYTLTSQINDEYGNESIGLSDDGFDDMTAYVVSLGEDRYIQILEDKCSFLQMIIERLRISDPFLESFEAINLFNYNKIKRKIKQKCTKKNQREESCS
jgi:hypothetical protein